MSFTVWLLVAMSQAPHNYGMPTVIAQFFKHEDCQATKAELDALARKDSKTACIAAKGIK